MKKKIKFSKDCKLHGIQINTGNVHSLFSDARKKLERNRKLDQKYIGQLCGFPAYINTKIVYVGGSFDLLHRGHIEFLRKCKEIDPHALVVVSLNTNKFCREYKREPVMGYRDRKYMLEKCPYVHKVVMNTGGYDSKPAILKVKPEYIVHGDDWTGPKYLKQLGIDKKFLKDHKIKLVYVPYTKGISTTEIINRIKKQK